MRRQMPANISSLSPLSPDDLRRVPRERDGETEQWKAGYLAWIDGRREYDNPHSAAINPDDFCEWRSGYEQSEEDENERDDDWQDWE